MSNSFLAIVFKLIEWVHALKNWSEDSKLFDHLKKKSFTSALGSAGFTGLYAFVLYKACTMILSLLYVFWSLPTNAFS